MGLEEDFLLADADDEKTIEFIKNYLPQELKEKFSDDELYYFLDLIDEYYSESGILDAQPDEDGYVNIDLEEVVAYIVKEAKKDEVGEYDPEEVLFVVQGEMEYGNSLGQWPAFMPTVITRIIFIAMICCRNDSDVNVSMRWARLVAKPISVKIWRIWDLI